MKKIITIMVLVLFTSLAIAQTNASKQTDRLEVSTTLRYRKGAEFIKDLIETFRYEGSLEGKLWLTGFYEPKFPNEATTQEERDERRRIREAYNKELDGMRTACPEHQKLFIVRASLDGPIALTYDMKDTALVLLKSFDMSPELGKTEVKSFKMKVDVAEYDSIQRLHLLAVYTAVPMDPPPSTKLVDTYLVRKPDAPLPVIPSLFNFDTMSFHFVWGLSTGDLYARSHTGMSPTAQKLIETFFEICKAVARQDYQHLRSQMPAVRELLTHYRSLLLPDVIVDEWTDENVRRFMN